MNYRIYCNNIECKNFNLIKNSENLFFELKVIPSKKKPNMFQAVEIKHVDNFSICKNVNFSIVDKIINHQIEKEKIEMMKEEDMYDVITHDILIDPVRFKSDEILIPHVVNRETALKLVKCPFTQSSNFVIVDAEDILKQINNLKKYSPDIYEKILKMQKNNKRLKIKQLCLKWKNYC